MDRRHELWNRRPDAVGNATIDRQQKKVGGTWPMTPEVPVLSPDRSSGRILRGVRAKRMAGGRAPSVPRRGGWDPRTLHCMKSSNLLLATHARLHPYGWSPITLTYRCTWDNSLSPIISIGLGFVCAEVRNIRFGWDPARRTP